MNLSILKEMIIKMVKLKEKLLKFHRIDLKEERFINKDKIFKDIHEEVKKEKRKNEGKYFNLLK